MKEYTVEQWFKLLPPEIREKAISYTSGYRLERKEPNLEDALSGSFLYHESPEGVYFWSSVACKDWGTPQDETVQDNTPETEDGTQINDILKHLQSGLPLTPIEAMKRYQCMRLAAVVHTLRDRGYAIITTMTGNGRKRYATYSMNVNGTSDN